MSQWFNVFHGHQENVNVHRGEHKNFHARTTLGKLTFLRSPNLSA